MKRNMEDTYDKKGITAKQLIYILAKELEVKNNEDFLIYITLSDPSIGARAFTTIKYASMGFDWESNQFRLEPSNEIVSREWRKDVPKTKIVDIICNRKYYFCPVCGGSTRVSKDDRYCKRCGQKLN